MMNGNFAERKLLESSNLNKLSFAATMDIDLVPYAD